MFLPPLQRKFPYPCGQTCTITSSEFSHLFRGRFEWNVPIFLVLASRRYGTSSASLSSTEAASVRLAILVNAFRPIQFLEEWLGQQQLARGAVEDVKETVAVGLQQELAGLRIPIMHVVRRELVIPLQLAGLFIQVTP